jgi:NO-binding membrane sensor protein with MHYT domain
VRLHESMLFDPTTARIHFWAMKFISLVDFEHEKTPMAFLPAAALVVMNPAAARSIASSQVARRRTPLSRTIGNVIRFSDEVLRPRECAEAMCLH